MFYIQPIISESSSPFVSTEVKPSFTTDIATPLGEFPDLVHDNSDLYNSIPTSVDLVHPIEQPPTPPPVPQPLKKFARPQKAPTYLHAYHCNLASTHVSALASLT